MRVGWPNEAILSPGASGFRFEEWMRQIHPDDRAIMETAFRDMASGAQTRFAGEFRVRRRPPAEGWAWVSSAGAVVDRDAATGVPLRIGGISRDVSERREAEARRLLLAREVDHRAKNLLAVVQSVLRLTPRDRPEEFAAAVERRVAALARAHTLLAEGGWAAADLGAVAARELGGLPPGTVRLEGPPAALVASAVQPVAMALHELATNAAKHGALSRPEGRVALRWRLDPGTATLRLTWTESGGPPVSTPPSRRGFGSRMIEATLEGQLSGSLDLQWQEDGLRAEIALPAARVLAADAGPEAEEAELALATGK
jgi:two-component sensor histidine kinase